MKLKKNGHLLKIFLAEGDKREGKLLYAWLVLKDHELYLAGATVLRGVMGYGAKSRIHTSKILRLSENLPIVIEIVDDLKKLEQFLAVVEGEIKEGLATVEKANVRFYRSFS